MMYTLQACETGGSTFVAQWVPNYVVVDKLLALNPNLCDQLNSSTGRPRHCSPLMVVDTSKSVMGGRLWRTPRVSHWNSVRARILESNESST